jgi:hypothetical protein
VSGRRVFVVCEGGWECVCTYVEGVLYVCAVVRGADYYVTPNTISSSFILTVLLSSLQMTTTGLPRPPHLATPQVPLAQNCSERWPVLTSS